ncbi:fimbria/pilus outer membrane usher protein [Pseudomonas sp. NFACC37-1]|uniref:fimbria/pilus outer membrane usher protein n=1 Tax=Pseudomonas sp. NFACC37-1 TaxID=1566196 RepID=UPI000885E277|nr:fimbria/pilus outer membrane usher protein [Pseudomonas sp. NFACC37-1]SCZ10457.1 outer membrane usher protein [Pseudomonas sp. NFACC37-1]
MTHVLARRRPLRQRLAPLFVLGGAVGGFDAKPASATQALEFQSGFMHQGGTAGTLALEALTQGQALVPGRYRVAVQINRHYIGERELDFSLDPDQQSLSPCLDAGLLEQLGVRLESLVLPQDAKCLDLRALIADARVEFDAGKLLLSLSVPQIAMRRDRIGQVDPEQWDAGINAAFVNYQVSAQQGTSRYRGSTSSDDLYLNSGLNLGAWRLRSNHALHQNTDGQREWTQAYTYAQRDLPGTRANLTLGKTFTGGEIFRSVPITGMVVASDMGMLPDLQQGYAPIIRGVAQARSKLEIKQNGYPIYSTYVSAGPYEIDDLSTAGGSGELEVVLTADDGQAQRFIQPYATLGNLLREGVWRYSATLGRYSAASGQDDPLLWQGTLALGSAWNTTWYGGVMGSDFYRAGNLGLARDWGGLGALAFDLTHSSAESGRGEGVQGMSYALKYSKAFQTSTSLRFAGYRYSTEGYRDFDESVRERNRDGKFAGSRRSRLEAAVFQDLGRTSSVNLTLSQDDYWGNNPQQRQFQFNLSTQHRKVSYNLFASQSLSDEHNGSRRQAGLSISFPLDFGHSNTATLGFQDNAGRYSQTARLTGSADQNRLSYSTALSNSDDNQRSATLALGYQAPFGSVGGGYTQGNGYRSLSLNASGALLLHGDGLEWGPYLGETMGLVVVPDTPGVGVLNATGVRTNAQGYALAPHLRPYRQNQVVLQTDQLDPEVEIDNGVTHVVPRRGAVVKAAFTARKVNRLVLTGRTPGGQPLPFGAQVSDARGERLGVVGQAGQVLLTTTAEPQTLDVRWGKEAGQHCQLQIAPQSMEQAQGYRLQTLTCTEPLAH